MNSTKKQITRLYHIVINNNQIYECWTCTGRLRRIIFDKSYQIDSKLYDEVAEKNDFKLFFKKLFILFILKLEI